jgi:hypothetical protein
MTVLYKYLETALVAVEQNPLTRQNFSDLGVTYRIIPPAQRKEVFERLGRVLKSNSENPHVCLNLAFFGAAAGRYDIVEIFSAVCDSNKRKSGLQPDELRLAKNMCNSSKIKVRRSDEIYNPLIIAAEECGLVESPVPPSS